MFCFPHRSKVRIVSSNRSGMGKSLYIRRLFEDLKTHQSDAAYVTLPLHGPGVTSDTVLHLLKDHFRNPTCCIYHIDIASNVSWQVVFCQMQWNLRLPPFQVLSEVDTILFSLLILRGLCDSQGRVWRCHPNQLYAIEVTKPKRNKTSHNGSFFPENQTLALLDLLPSVSCLSPHATLNTKQGDYSQHVVCGKI